MQTLLSAGIEVANHVKLQCQARDLDCASRQLTIPAMTLPTSLRIRRHGRASIRAGSDSTLERAKNIATIVSAVAVPLVLAIVGYFVQRELSTEGLRKDYVGIAAGILKEEASRQEPELRAWAVQVLDDNSPVPFSKKAKAGLFAGTPVVLAGPAWLGPPPECRKPPQKRTVLAKLSKLSKEAEGLDQRELLLRMQDFVDAVVQQEAAALDTVARLDCLQKWVNHSEQSDIEYRQAIGAPSSQSVYERLNNEAAASSVKPTR